MSATIDEVKTFWDAHPCQSDLSQTQERKRYFEEITAKRYGGREWHVPIVAKFGNYCGKDVLEVGCGIGTDGFEFARHGARYVGVDLTPNSIKIAKERFDLFSVPGRFEIANAEDGLPFPDNSFDHTYSFGVIHHSPRTEAIVNEIRRVLRPDGTFAVMLYNRSSINYYIEIMFLRKLFRLLLYPSFMPGVLARLTGFDEWKLKGHRDIFMSRGKLTKEQWVSINTDGPFCPLAKVYSKKEAAKLFHNFSDVQQEVWEFNSEHWSFLGKLIPTRMERAIGRRWGWHRMIYGRKVG